MGVRSAWAGLLAACLVSAAAAQMHSPAPVVRGMRGGDGPRFHRSAPLRNSLIYSSPFFYDDYADFYQQPVPEPAPQIVSLPAAPEIEVEPRLPDPVVMEWNGDRFVRVNGSSAMSDTASRNLNRMTSVVLVFRDGREQTVASYAIADGAVYAEGNLYRDGFWTKRIDLASLNVPATVEANAQRGVKFVLPGGPHEVTVGF
jgi:hypothetical protein